MRKVKCIYRPGNLSLDLFPGNTYSMIGDPKEGYIKVINDRGDIVVYSDRYFVELEENYGMLKLNENKDHVNKILIGLAKNGGYCCCQIVNNIGSLCKFSSDYLPNEIEMDELCLNGQDENRCCCGLFIGGDI